jgi:serine/threonine-protein kinase
MNDPAKPAPEDEPSSSVAAVLARLRQQQRADWERGDRLPAEAYLERCPAVRADPEAVLDLIYQEALLREERGERAHAEEYAQRFPELRRQLKQLFEVHEFLTDSLLFRTEPPRHRPPAPASPRAGRYRLFGEIGRGGMGAVLRGHDPDLRRDLAVKVLLEEHRDDPAIVRRFIEEAQVGGQLQHPGVVPVYELGHFDDRRPFFAMKLVEGRTLAELLHERQGPAEELPQFLAIFEQVCQAVGYAHSHGVIHRDLKPANVMVGRFGEVQVMDWGLAKVLPHPPAPSPKQGEGEQDRSREDTTTRLPTATTPAPPSPVLGEGGWGGEGRTQPGSVMGTPAYMAPEQARGETDRLDQRADVFGLGAILCVILTGEPPYAGATGHEVYLQAACAELANAFARLEGCGASPELIALAKRCLAPERDHRPRDGGEVAQAVATYRAGVEERLRQTEMERVAAEARATAERRARRLTAGLAAAVIGLVAVAAGAGLWLQRQAAQRREEVARQEADLRREVESALDKVAELQKHARWQEARAVLDQTRSRLGDGGPDDLRRRTDQAGDDLRLVGLLDDARFKLTALVGEGEYDFKAAERAYESAFRSAGLGEPEGDEEGLVARINDSAVRAQLLAALDAWALVTGTRKRRAWLLRVARAADPGPWRDRFRNPDVWEDRQAAERLAREAKVAELPVPLLIALAAVLPLTEADPVPLLTAAATHHPDDFWVNFLLGNALLKANRPADALGHYRAALAVRPNAALVRSEMGAALLVLRRPHEAAAECRRAIALDGRLALAHLNLGTVLHALGRTDEALAAYRQAVALSPRSALAHAGLGGVLAEKNQTDEALAACRRAIKLRPNLAVAHLNLGVALNARGEVDEAINAWRKALGLVAANKGVETRQVLLAEPLPPLLHNNLGAALYRKGRVDESIGHYHQAIALSPRAPAPHCNLAAVLLQQGRFEEARAAYRNAVPLVPKDHPLRPSLAALLQKCDRLLALEPKLSAIVRGEIQPADAAEGIDYAVLCVCKGLLHAAARLYAGAFARDPKLADGRYTNHRYNAACAAVRAAAERGAGAAPEGERARLRAQALGWLRADLALQAGLLKGGQGAGSALVRQKLRHWQSDPDLASVRDAAALAKLPAREQMEWKKLWAEVSALIERAGAAK